MVELNRRLWNLPGLCLWWIVRHRRAAKEGAVMTRWIGLRSGKQRKKAPLPEVVLLQSLYTHVKNSHLRRERLSQLKVSCRPFGSVPQIKATDPLRLPPNVLRSCSDNVHHHHHHLNREKQAQTPPPQPPRSFRIFFSLIHRESKVTADHLLNCVTYDAGKK